jgi:hypothetical protein
MTHFGFSDRGVRLNRPCQARLDRATFGAIPDHKKGIQIVPGYKRVADFKPHRQGKIVAYDRVRKFRGLTNSSEINIQYERRVPWVPPERVTMIGHDQTGLTLEEIESVTSQCYRHSLSMVELALDFPPESVDCQFVLRYGHPGKSRRRVDRGGPGTLRYGGRQCPKLVRCYLKKQLGCFRVELEIHRPLLRKYGVEKVFDLATVATTLIPAHMKFVAIRWSRLETYLTKKFGPDGTRIEEEARRRADSSLRAATRYLAKNGVTNPHRFLASLKINRDVQEALRRWAEVFAPDRWE